MIKAKINANSRAGVALRSPKFPCVTDAVSYLKNGTVLLVDTDDIIYNLPGEAEYIKVYLDSGKSGYVKLEGLEEL